MSQTRHTDYEGFGAPEAFDATHFGGPVGELFRQTQEKTLFALIEPEEARILDVGAGTGRTAIPLARRGAFVIALDASAQMLRRAQEKASALPNLSFQIGDARYLPFASKSFDYAVSFRTLMHFSDWQRVISEMCRVSRNAIVFDAPPTIGAPLVEALFDRLRHLWSPEVRPYRTFFVGELRRELRKNGFELASVHKQLVLPLKLHRLINSLAFTQISERLLGFLGLRLLLGSPVTIKAVRNTS